MSMANTDPPPGCTVLVVEDDVELCNGLQLLLKSERYEALGVTQGADALKAVMAHRPDLVVLDVMMPHVDGWEVLAAIRAEPSISDTPVMMLTAKSSVDNRVRGLELGADDYLTKPFAVREFKARVRALLRRGRAASPGGRTRLPLVSEREGHQFVDAAEVYYIEGMRNYSYVHTDAGKQLSRLSLGEMEHRLPDSFMRIHRSYIVNLDTVRGCRWKNKSTFVVRVGDPAETEVPVSRTLVSTVRTRLGL